jgi:hypothetical protein
LLPAILLFGALRRLARQAGASTLRFQPWPGGYGDGTLTRAARVLGFLGRGETEMVVHTRDAALDNVAIQVNPFFYVTF